MRGLHRLSSQINSEIVIYIPGVRRVLRSVSEGRKPDHRLRPQMIVRLNQRGRIAETAGMLAWKQPFI